VGRRCACWTSNVVWWSRLFGFVDRELDCFFFFGSTVHEEWSRRCTLRFGVHTRGETIVTSTAPYLGLPRAL
jgi:hypothetical protein